MRRFLPTTPLPRWWGAVPWYNWPNGLYDASDLCHGHYWLPSTTTSTTNVKCPWLIPQILLLNLKQKSGGDEPTLKLKIGAIFLHISGLLNLFIIMDHVCPIFLFSFQNSVHVYLFGVSSKNLPENLKIQTHFRKQQWQHTNPINNAWLTNSIKGSLLCTVGCIK